MKIFKEQGLQGTLVILLHTILRNLKLKPISKNPAYLLNEEPFFYVKHDRSALEAFKNKYKGKRCFIIGNGPSLNLCNLSLLKNEYSFGVNGIFYKTKENGFTPSFYVVEDSHVMMDNLSEINEYHANAMIRFFPTEYKHLIKSHNNTIFFRMNRGYYDEHSPYFRVPRFSTDASDRLYCGQSVTILNLQLAYHMGFSEVYLIGMDFSYIVPDTAKVRGDTIESTEPDPNHFHKDYFGKGKKWHDPKLDQVGISYKLSKLIYESSGRKIYNATIGGNLDIFERVDFNSLF